MKTIHKTKFMRGRFAALRQWVVLVQRKKGGAWIVLPPLPPFELLVRSSAPESPFLERLRKTVEDVKKAPCVIVQKSVMVDFFRRTEEYHGPRWEMFRLFIRMHEDMLRGEHHAVRLLAPGGIVAVEEFRHSMAADVANTMKSALPNHSITQRGSTIKISPTQGRS